MQPLNLSLPPLLLPEQKSSRNPDLHSHSSSTLLLNHMNPNESNLPMPADKSTASFTVRKTSPTSSAMTSETGTLPELKKSQLGVSLQPSKGKEREKSVGKSLLERMGMKQLSLLEHLGVPIKGKNTSQICDSTGTMMMTLPKLSRNKCTTMTMSMTCTMLGTGVHVVGNPLGEVR